MKSPSVAMKWAVDASYTNQPFMKSQLRTRARTNGNKLRKVVKSVIIRNAYHREVRARSIRGIALANIQENRK